MDSPGSTSPDYHHASQNILAPCSCEPPPRPGTQLPPVQRGHRGHGLVTASSPSKRQVPALARHLRVSNPALPARITIVGANWAFRSRGAPFPPIMPVYISSFSPAASGNPHPPPRALQSVAAPNSPLRGEEDPSSLLSWYRTHQYGTWKPYTHMPPPYSSPHQRL